MEQSLVGRIIIKAMSLGWLNWMSDSSYLKIMYRIQMGEKLNLKNPKTYNEKLQWLKIHNRKPVYTVMVDKYAAKDFIAEKVGRQYVVPTLGVWEKFEEIDFDAPVSYTHLDVYKRQVKEYTAGKIDDYRMV